MRIFAATSFLCILLALFFYSCHNDKGLLPPVPLPAPGSSNACDSVKYSVDVVPVINAQCATSGCHDAGNPNGDYTTYAGVKAKVDNGSFNNRVFILKDMPQGTTLSAADYNKLKCWYDKGALNN